ncbi:MAG: carboxymuconolactone decarboxylase family protein [Porticoccus sp.]|nr:carboxymuconolactone decarboxylase family protein [Porticoccus sp.]MBQ0807900.1 carboxymuconolactone decarboxylase family protein [Porticoccus sp.]
MKSEYKISLPPVTIEAAGDSVKSTLEQQQANFGFLPNMYQTMANSPALLKTYLFGYEQFRTESDFTPCEQEVVFIVLSRENGCEYCVGAHSFIADNMSGVPVPVTDAIRTRSTIEDSKLQALATFTKVLHDTRGLPTRTDVEGFIGAGYTEKNILEIILAMSVKTLSNYSNHICQPELDDVFSGRAWSE